MMPTKSKLTGNKQLSFWGSELGKYTYIFISGKAGVGKTTVANYMKLYLDGLGYLTFTTPLAKEVKNCAREYFGWDGNKDERGRTLLQRVGTEIGREYDPDIWVKHLVNNTYKHIIHPDFTLVDDWRFPNEAAFVEKLTEYNVAKIRIESTERESLRGTPQEFHESEISLPSDQDGNGYYDFVIYNNTSLNNLKEMAEKLVNILLERSKK